eukprot:TRINITY_DN6596_c0_g1_i1.p1 TRINITY_DN6596_c0_g1~~TRINITY_DN6596_c0_g1_i1.p1  ORF type:complete len:441 (-),score=81.19 TRINITY_DN6596_c0_g1_i1:264-1586(-)
MKVLLCCLVLLLSAQAWAAGHNRQSSKWAQELSRLSTLPTQNMDGELQVIMGKPAQGGQTYFREFFLTQKTRWGKSVHIKLPNIEDFYDSHSLHTGMKLSVSGKVRPSGPGVSRAILAMNATVDWEHFRAMQNAKKRSVQAAAPRRVAVVFVNMPDGAPVITKTQYDAYFTSNTKNVRSTIARMTNNVHTFAAPGAGYSKFSVTIEATIALCDYQVWLSQTIAALQRQGVNVDDYDHLSMITPDCRNCGFGGLGIVDCTQYKGSYCWSQVGQDSPATIIHEFGHNLGMHHSGNWTEEYADGSCVMGMAEGFALINIIQRVRLGWMRANMGVRSVSSGTFTVFDAWNTLVTYPLGLRVGWDVGDYDAYFVSYRLRTREDPDLSDEFHNKVTLHYLPPNEAKPRIMGVMAVGEALYDEGSNIRITFVSSDPAARTAQIAVEK